MTHDELKTLIAAAKAFVADQQQWATDGLPARDPITVDEVNRRADMVEKMVCWIERHQHHHCC